MRGIITPEIIFACLVVVVITEMILSGTFNKFYFTIGVPLFWRDVSCAPGASQPPKPEQLELSMPSTLLYPLSFRQLDQWRYGFRERFWGGGFFRIHYTPLMHGLLTFDADAQRVRVIGLANWSSIALLIAPVFIAVTMPVDDAVTFGLFFLAVLVVLFAIQAARFTKVGNVAAASWSKSSSIGDQPQARLVPTGLDTSPTRRAASVIRIIERVSMALAMTFFLALAVLMVIGTQTVEWTCREVGGDWQCVGPNCSSEAQRRFGATHHSYSCKRSDWPMVTVERVMGSLMRLAVWSPSASDFMGDGGSPDVSLNVPRAQEEPAVPEVSGDGVTTGGVTTLLSTSFELAVGEDRSTTRPFLQNGKLPWGRDTRARSGQLAINVIPRGNPGDLRYFGFDNSISSALLSSRLTGEYAPFRVESFRRVELEFWRLSTSNPSETHNCLGSLVVDYRLDGGEWQSKMDFCGTHKSKPRVWKHSVLEFDTAGHRVLEFRFGYDYPPDTHRDKAAVYLIDDLVVRGYQ